MWLPVAFRVLQKRNLWDLNPANLFSFLEAKKGEARVEGAQLPLPDAASGTSQDKGSQQWSCVPQPVSRPEEMGSLRTSDLLSPWTFNRGVAQMGKEVPTRRLGLLPLVSSFQDQM